MASVFDVFKQVSMEYLVLGRGKVYGDLTEDTKTIQGIFKVRSGMNTSGGIEAKDSSATVHVHPEDFTTLDNIIGNGIKYDGITYEIVGLTEGRNFATNQVEHITLTLNRLTTKPASKDTTVEGEGTWE